MKTPITETKDLPRRSNQEVWGEDTLEFLEDYVAGDYVEYNNASSEPIRGREGYRENVEMVRDAFPDLSVTTEDQIAEGEKVVTRYTIRGTHEHEFVGIEPTGNAIEIEGISIGKLEDGNVVEGWSNIDVRGMMQKIGDVEPSGE